MLKIQSTFSGFTVNNIDEAKKFYGQTLGFELEDKVGGTVIKLPAGSKAWMYQKQDHQPAAYTMLNFIVDNIDNAYEALAGKGVQFIHYPASLQDDKGIMRGKELNMGPSIAWFTDPSGNILAILEN